MNEVRILNYFSRRSGFSKGRVHEKLGDTVVEHLQLPSNQVLDIYLGSDPDDKVGLEVFTERAKRQNNPRSEAPFWRDLLAYSIYKNKLGNFQESTFEVIAESGLVQLRRQLRGYSRSNWSFYQDISKEENSTHPLFLNFDEEEIEERAKVVQVGLNALQKIGLDIIDRGNIPLMRVLYLDPVQKEQFMAKHAEGGEFSPKDEHVGLDGYTLADIAKHSDIKREASPLDSWTYVSPASKVFYGYSRLGLSGDMIILMTERSPDELVWTRELQGLRQVYPTFQQVYPAQWHYYKEHNLEANSIGEESKLANLNDAGVKGVIVPGTEFEAVLWGKQPIRGIVDISPNFE